VSISAIVRALVAAKATPEMILAAVEAAEASNEDALERRLASDAAKSRRYRERGGGAIPGPLRAEVLERDNYECQDCASGDYLQIDHIHPVSKGGPTVLENLQVLCRVCNARKKDRIRKGIPRNSTEFLGKSTDNLSTPKEKSPTPPKEITPSIPVSEPIGSSTESAREFADFWSLFPNKIAKRDAQKAFTAARKRSSFESIMAGLRRYVAKTDDRAWCNPSTFLNQDRWDDQPADVVPRSGAPPPQQNPFGGFENFARKRGLIGEPGSNHSLDEDAGKLPRHHDRRDAGSQIVPFRGGIGGRYERGDL